MSRWSKFNKLGKRINAISNILFMGKRNLKGEPEAFPVQSGGLTTNNDRPVHNTPCIFRNKKQTNLITHSGNDGTVPVGRKACNGLQGEGASWSYECDDVGFEMHVRRQTWGDVSGARGVTARTRTNTRKS